MAFLYMTDRGLAGPDQGNGGASSCEAVMEDVARGFEAVGVAIIVIGGIAALIDGFRDFGDMHQLFVDVRRGFGRPIILGLEVLVAADIIRTTTVDPSLESVGVLGVLVAVRIALSFSLDIEVDGMLPWRRAQIEAAQHENNQK